MDEADEQLRGARDDPVSENALLAATIDYEERQIPFHESHAVALVLGLSLTTETSF